VLPNDEILKGLAQPIGEIELYCDNPECPARTVFVRVKDYGGGIPVNVVCPLCRRLAKVHTVMKPEEVRQRRRSEAIGLVAELRLKAKQRKIDPLTADVIHMGDLLTEMKQMSDELGLR